MQAGYATKATDSASKYPTPQSKTQRMGADQRHPGWSDSSTHLTVLKQSMSKLTILSATITLLLMNQTGTALLFASILLIPETLERALKILGLIQEQVQTVPE